MKEDALFKVIESTLHEGKFAVGKLVREEIYLTWLGGSYTYEEAVERCKYMNEKYDKPNNT